MVDAHQNLNALHDLTTPLLWMVCHPRAITCYEQPIYQIWSLYLLHTLRRYERRYKMSKMVLTSDPKCSTCFNVHISLVNARPCL